MLVISDLTKSLSWSVLKWVFFVSVEESMFTLAEKEIIDILWWFPYDMEEKKI